MPSRMTPAIKSCLKQDISNVTKSTQVKTLTTSYETETEQDYSDESSLDIEIEI